MNVFKEIQVGDTVTVTVTATVTEVSAGSIEIEGGQWFSSSDPDTVIVRVP